MRIISGSHKGRRITAPKKLPVRPTTDMAKEGIFNILKNRYYLEDLRVLDLFSGTGNISFEMASRGVQGITAVDQHAGCTKFIHNTAQEFDFDISVIKSDVFKFLERTKTQYDLIFADPPYDMPLEKFEQIPALIFENNLLAPEGLLIVEHSPQTNLENLPFFQENRKYGSNVFSFFEAIT
ncbi:RsmD family RNA methyltransferase [Croceivirga sp. JEA036]|uniref:RsmD family RNA methyltransferase n=1 Tax=Croceivirga sp. JEA036 TaxID=2721162 RepID=UPI00143B5F33|nr:RsmD family RNA methyltransferase [Croceivirga sp. JEA036]NJB35041.1 methyltransferase [Croceivirga sp. JEA036]